MRNKGATLHLLDVLVTQHAKWTAKCVRLGLFGQSIVDFPQTAGPAFSCNNLQKAIHRNQLRSKQRRLHVCYAVLRRRGYMTSISVQELSRTKVGDNDIFAGQTLVPGMSLYEFSQVSDAESQAVGDEEPMIFDS